MEKYWNENSPEPEFDVDDIKESCQIIPDGILNQGGRNYEGRTKC